MSNEPLLLPAIFERSTLRTKRHIMTYATAAFFSFSYSILAASIAIFLQDRFSESPNAIFLIGAILGFASVGALFIDSFWAYLQKIRQPRFLLFLALGGLMTTVSIFLFSSVFPFLGWTAFTIVAALLYGWGYDLFDITVLTVILRWGDSEHCAQSISQKKFAEAIGMLFGVMISGFLLFFGSAVAQIVLLGILVGVFIFAAHHFDREEDETVLLEFSQKSLVNWERVFFLLVHPTETEAILKNVSQGLKEEILTISRETEKALKNLPSNAKKTAQEITDGARKKLIEILARENEIVKSAFPEPEFRFGEMIRESKALIGEFLTIFTRRQNMLLLWGAIVVVFFSFWDTMAIVFQPLFLQKVANGSGWLRAFSGVLMASFLVPILIFQMPFSALSDRFGRAKFVVMGILVSSVSLLFLGTAKTLGTLFLAGLGNSLGYALAFVPAQALLVREMEKTHKDASTKKEKSAGILRVALNFGNILGQFAGGFVFSTIGFSAGFFAFGAILLLFGMFSIVFLIRNSGKKVAPKIEESLV